MRRPGNRTTPATDDKKLGVTNMNTGTMRARLARAILATVICGGVASAAELDYRLKAHAQQVSRLLGHEDQRPAVPASPSSDD